MEIYKKLMKIQEELKSPKGQFNKFGGYKYRSCEDILESVKPLCAKNGALLIMRDEIVSMECREDYESSSVKIGKERRFYVKAIAILIDVETGDKVEVQAFAREEDSKKGMDSCQVTGSASSYARKYALNALFCIDDTKDSDYTNKGNATEGKKSEDKKEVGELIELAKENGFTVVNVKKVAMAAFNKFDLNELSNDQIAELKKRIETSGGKKNERRS